MVSSEIIIVWWRSSPWSRGPSHSWAFHGGIFEPFPLVLGERSNFPSTWGEISQDGASWNVGSTPTSSKIGPRQNIETHGDLRILYIETTISHSEYPGKTIPRNRTPCRTFPDFDPWVKPLKFLCSKLTKIFTISCYEGGTKKHGVLLPERYVFFRSKTGSWQHKCDLMWLFTMKKGYLSSQN